MDNQYVNNLRKQVKKALSSDKMRYWHSIGVANTCACLAMRYGTDIQDAYVAGLLHDCAKVLSDKELIDICNDNKIPVSEFEQKSPYLLHSKVGSYFAKTLYGINNSEICSAIEFHTTGKPQMTLLEEIVFIADYIEPYRNKAANLERIRELAFCDIKAAIYAVCSDTINYLERQSKTIDTLTIDTYKYYKNLVS